MRAREPAPRNARDDAREQASATDRHDDGVDVGQLLQQLETESALTGDHVGVVEGVHERRLLFCGQGERALTGLAVIAAGQDDLGAVGDGGFDLAEGRRLRHDDGGRTPAMCAA